MGVCNGKNPNFFTGFHNLQRFETVIIILIVIIQFENVYVLLLSPQIRFLFLNSTTEIFFAA